MSLLPLEAQSGLEALEGDAKAWAISESVWGRAGRTSPGWLPESPLGLSALCSDCLQSSPHTERHCCEGQVSLYYVSETPSSSRKSLILTCCLGRGMLCVCGEVESLEVPTPPQDKFMPQSVCVPGGCVDHWGHTTLLHRVRAPDCPHRPSFLKGSCP